MSADAFAREANGGKMSGSQTGGTLDAIVRGLSSAAKALQLYPPASPIPRQSLETATEALSGYLTSQAALSLAVGRAGLTADGDPLASGSPGVVDLADSLRAHGVASVEFLPGCSVEDLIVLLQGAAADPDGARAAGGLAGVLAAAGVDRVRVTGVALTVVADDIEIPDVDVEGFLRELGGDADKLGAWLTAMARRDTGLLSDGLAELGAAAGAAGQAALAANLARAFSAQDSQGKDALLGVALDPGEAHSLMADALRLVEGADLGSALADGLYGRNMLSLSNAMTNLPFGDRLAAILVEVKRSLAADGRSLKEAEFLDHMVDVHRSPDPEMPLVDADATYRAVAAAATLSPEDTGRARAEATGAQASARAVTTMLALLDQQTDHDLYVNAVDNLARTVPGLLEAGDVVLATKVISELRAREARRAQPWPDFAERLRAGVDIATGRRSMAALLAAVTRDPSLVGAARELLRISGDAADSAFAEEAVALKAEGIALAEEIIGRRVVDLLAMVAPTAQWFQLQAIAARLGKEGDSRSVAALRQLVARPDEQSRREVTTGLAEAGGAQAATMLVALSRDASEEVASAAVRALGRLATPEATEALAARLGALDLDGKDFPLAREVIGALARAAGPIAKMALERLVGRKALIKRGHFAEVQELARQGLEHVRRGGGEA
jgi:hypothetical protein